MLPLWKVRPHKAKLLKLAQENKFDSSYQQDKEKANNADLRQRQRSSSTESEGESIGLVARHALSACAGRSHCWIVDSVATCHMCNDLRQFVKMQNLEKPLEVTLGDGHELQAIGHGVVLETKVAEWKSEEMYFERCAVHTEIDLQSAQ